MNCNQYSSTIKYSNILKKIMIAIFYKSFEHLTLVIITNYNLQKITIIIRCNQLFTPKHECGHIKYKEIDFAPCNKSIMANKLLSTNLY